MHARFVLPLLLVCASPLAAATADISVYAIANVPPAIDPGAEYTVYFEAFSYGPEPAEHPRMTITLPAGSRVVDASSQLGACVQNGVTFTCESSQPLASAGLVTVGLTIQAPSDLLGGIETMTATVSSDATDPHPENNTATATITVNHLFVVDSDADDGSGSLRQAILAVNAACGGELPCRIAFAREMTIEPASPLPPITALNVTIDGGGAASTPRRVTLRGTRQSSGDGLTLQLPFARSFLPLSIAGLAIEGFPGNGIEIGELSPQGPTGGRVSITQCTITANRWRGIAAGAPHTALTIASNVISGNGRSGVALWDTGSASLTGNRVESNGASGIYAGAGFVAVSGNGILTNHEYGISTSPAASLAHDGNVIRDNAAQPIDIMMDGPSRAGSVRPPQLTDAFYDAAAKRTIIRGHLAGTISSKQNEETFQLGFAATTGLNASGYADAQTPLVSFFRTIPALDPAVQSLSFDVPFEASVDGDLRGHLIVGYTSWAAWPDLPYTASSELSDAVLVH